MTEIVFYTGVSECNIFAVRLASKLYDEGHRVRIHTENEQATRILDKLLWTYVQGSFVPHCQIDAAIALDTPVWIDHTATHPGGAAHADVLINLANDMPDYFARFVKVADIVGETAPQVEAGRNRYRIYKDQGYALTHHNMTGKL